MVTLESRVATLEAANYAICQELKQLKKPKPDPEPDPKSALFYPDTGDMQYELHQHGVHGRYIVEPHLRQHGISDQYPYIRTEEQAKRIAWARGEADKWRAMGVMPCDDEERYFIGVNSPNPGWWEYISAQQKEDALFLTREGALEALEKFGGIEHLNKVRRGLWGME